MRKASQRMSSKTTCPPSRSGLSRRSASGSAVRTLRSRRILLSRRPRRSILRKHALPRKQPKRSKLMVMTATTLEHLPKRPLLLLPHHLQRPRSLLPKRLPRQHPLLPMLLRRHLPKRRLQLQLPRQSPLRANQRLPRLQLQQRTPDQTSKRKTPVQPRPLLLQRVLLRRLKLQP